MLKGNHEPLLVSKNQLTSHHICVCVCVVLLHSVTFNLCVCTHFAILTAFLNYICDAMT